MFDGTERRLVAAMAMEHARNEISRTVDSQTRTLVRRPLVICSPLKEQEKDRPETSRVMEQIRVGASPSGSGTDMVMLQHLVDAHV